MKVSKYMSPKVISARADEGVRTVFFRMRRERIRHMPVVDGGKNLIGWISDRDLRRPEWADPEVDLSYHYNLDDEVTVGDLMNPNPTAVHTFDTMHKAVGLFREHRWGALPVLDKTETLVGVLSQVDCLTALSEVLDELHAAKKAR